jgi:hypothetical protein
VREFERRRPEDDPGWFQYFDDAELSAEFGHCLRDLRRAEDAALGRMATDFNRFRGTRTSEPAADHPHATALTAFPRKRIVQIFTS